MFAYNVQILKLRNTLEKEALSGIRYPPTTAQEGRPMIICPSCQQEAEDDWRFFRRCGNQLQVLGDEFVSGIQFVTMPGLDLASREMRGIIHAGRSIRFMTPRSVEMYIEQHGLYRDAR